MSAKWFFRNSQFLIVILNCDKLDEIWQLKARNVYPSLRQSAKGQQEKNSQWYRCTVIIVDTRLVSITQRIVLQCAGSVPAQINYFVQHKVLLFHFQWLCVPVQYTTQIHVFMFITMTNWVNFKIKTFFSLTLPIKWWLKADLSWPYWWQSKMSTITQYWWKLWSRKHMT